MDGVQNTFETLHYSLTLSCPPSSLPINTPLEGVLWGVLESPFETYRELELGFVGFDYTKTSRELEGGLDSHL